MIGIIGNGSWATALAKILTDNHHAIKWWMRNDEAVAHLLQRHHNPHYLTSVKFTPTLIAPTTDALAVIQECDTVIICVPSAYLEPVLQALPETIFEDKVVISAVKGILPESRRLLNDYLVADFRISEKNYIAITGPCHAEEVSQERLSYLTFSGLDTGLATHIASLFANDYIKTNHNHDLWGAQYAAVLKNIYAIGAGMAHGLGHGDNFLSVYITNCYRELYLFSDQQFQKLHPETEKPDFHTSAYLGDLLVTCYSLHSRNRAFGNLLGKGYSIKAAMAEMNMVAEGYYAVRGMRQIAAKLQIDLPIVDEIRNVLWNDKPLKDALKVIEAMLS